MQKINIVGATERYLCVFRGGLTRLGQRAAGRIRARRVRRVDELHLRQALVELVPVNHRAGLLDERLQCRPVRLHLVQYPCLQDVVLLELRNRSANEALHF